MLQKRTLCIAFLAIISFTTSSAAACSANKVAVEAAVPLTCGKFNISKSTEPICVDIKSSAATKALLSFTGELDVTSANPNEKARGGRAFIAEILKTQDTNCVNLNEYGTALVMIMIPAALFWFLNGLCCCCCTCCHSCCKICSGCKSCKCIPRTEKMYTTCERNVPVLFMLLFCLLFMVFAGVGIAKGMFEFNDSLVGGVCQIDNWYIGVKDFNAKLKTPLETLRVDFDLAVKDLKEAAVIDPALQENVDAIAPLFGLIGEKATIAKDAAAAGTKKVWSVTLTGGATAIVAAEGSPVTQVGGATGTLAKVKVTGQTYGEFSVISNANGNFAPTGAITIGTGCTIGCTHAAVAVVDGTAKTKETCEGLFEDITTQMNSAKAASTGQAEDLAKTLTDTQTMINDNIIVMAGPADEKIVLITKALDDFDRQVEAILNPKKFVGVDLFTYAKIVREQRSSSAFAAFGIWFIAAMLAVIGVIGMKFMHQEKFLEVGEKRNPELTGDVIALSCMGRCFSRVTCCSWWLVLFFGISSGFFALMFLPIAAVGRDICQVLPTLPQDIGQMFDNADITKLTNSCWNSSSNLFDGFNAGDAIDTSAISFGDFAEKFGDNNPEIDTTGLDDLKDLLNGEDIQAFCNPTNKISDVLTQTADTKLQVETAENAFATSTIVADITKSGAKLVAEITKGIVAIRAASTCYFLACGWQDTVDVICDGLITSVGFIATAELFLAAICIPFALFIMCIQKTHGGHGPIPNEAQDAKFDTSIEMGTKGGSADKYAVADAEVYAA